MLQLRKLFGASRTAPLRVESGTPGQSQPSVLRAIPAGRKHHDVIGEGEKHFVAGRYAQALQVVDEALQSDANDAALLFARGATLFAWGRFYEALRSLERARHAGMIDFDLDMQLGWTFVNLQRLREAEVCFKSAVAANP